MHTGRHRLRRPRKPSAASASAHAAASLPTLRRPFSPRSASPAPPSVTATGACPARRRVDCGCSGECCCASTLGSRGGGACRARGARVKPVLTNQVRQQRAQRGRQRRVQQGGLGRPAETGLARAQGCLPNDSTAQSTSKHTSCNTTAKCAQLTATAGESSHCRVRPARGAAAATGASCCACSACTSDSPSGSSPPRCFIFSSAPFKLRTASSLQGAACTPSDEVDGNASPHQSAAPCTARPAPRTASLHSAGLRCKHDKHSLGLLWRHVAFIVRRQLIIPCIGPAFRSSCCRCRAGRLLHRRRPHLWRGLRRRHAGW